MRRPPPSDSRNARAERIARRAVARFLRHRAPSAPSALDVCQGFGRLSRLVLRLCELLLRRGSRRVVLCVLQVELRLGHAVGLLFELALELLLLLLHLFDLLLRRDPLSLGCIRLALDVEAAA